ncbi:zinc-binding dehydrogenase [Duganella sp. FT135W]|uniref:Zinc-binding dehydrogenase n=2 Tax=Duganella flavida TaxID=2692175 RepID=A0A6L8K8Q2_9BURK|nr:quinone oxidoreductase [Duganella flavida]MYM22194.1 zinc-binding dehydrogenase [Duganella flavida]
MRVRELKRVEAGEALVRIAKIGVNFADIYRRTGFDPQPLPFIPGLEAAGMVEEVGAGVHHVKRGDRVAFGRQPGAYAEACIVPAGSLIALPDTLSYEQGAAIPLQGMTAHYLIHDFRKPGPGDVVLIHAAAGGVGSLLVQWARHLGAHVIGSVSTLQKAQVARRVGAHDVIVYTEQNFAEETMRLTKGHGADLIIDGVAKSTFNANLDAIAVRGHIVIFGAASGPAVPISPNALMPRSVSLSGGDLQHFLQSTEELQRRAHDVITGVLEGWLTQEIFQIFPLSKAAEAHRLLQGRHTTGKLLLSTGTAAASSD